MLALVPLGSELERIMGSVRMFYITILLATSNAILHLLIALLVAHIPFYRLQNVMDECAIGFSGVIFSLIVIETSLSGAQSRSVFGLFNIPAKWYPLILLVLFQVLMTNVSLLGHLCGILSGFAYTYGFFNLLMPGTSFYSAIESSSLLITSINQSPLTDMQPTQDSRFPGRGRTLSSSQSPVHVDSNLQARLLDNSSPENRSHMIVTETGDRLSDERQPALGTAVAVDRVPAGQQGAVVSDEEIQKLVSMGFDKTQVEVALAAADGDLNVAVEILSQQLMDKIVCRVKFIKQSHPVTSRIQISYYISVGQYDLLLQCL
ncbi:Rhomboid-like protein 15 [Citrus sinensis]|uniref:Rhomboid-like protein 15 n=1 Tax=Citrus sinensis TaxID=2711 RepID=A0ACB8JY26_CITSI|nr:Rhomboid-like protein 15 [Citrus sinensis]